MAHIVLQEIINNVYQIKGNYVISLGVKDLGVTFKITHRAAWLWMDNNVSIIHKFIVSQLMD